jgi:hypothetical protein
MLTVPQQKLYLIGVLFYHHIRDEVPHLSSSYLSELLQLGKSLIDLLVGPSSFTFLTFPGSVSLRKMSLLSLSSLALLF